MVVPFETQEGTVTGSRHPAVVRVVEYSWEVRVKEVTSFFLDPPTNTPKLR